MFTRLFLKEAHRKRSTQSSDRKWKFFHSGMPEATLLRQHFPHLIKPTKAWGIKILEIRQRQLILASNLILLYSDVELGHFQFLRSVCTRFKTLINIEFKAKQNLRAYRKIFLNDQQNLINTFQEILKRKIISRLCRSLNDHQKHFLTCRKKEFRLKRTKRDESSNSLLAAQL